MSKPITISKRWWEVVFYSIFLITAMIGGMWSITWPAILAVQAGHPLPEDWTWPGIIAVNSIIFGLFSSVCWAMIRDNLITFTEEGISEITMLGKVKTVRWLEVQQVQYHYPFITVRSATHMVRINTSWFNTKELAFLIQRHVPVHTLAGRPVTESDFE